MILRCALVDDEPLALSLLESYVRKTDSLELCGSYSSAIQAMKSLPEHPVDLLFFGYPDAGTERPGILTHGL